MNHKYLKNQKTLDHHQPYPIFQRIKSDFIAVLLTICVVAICLGSTILYFAMLNQALILSPEKSLRWFQSALPISAFLVFILSYLRAMPWFAGILASLVASQVPGLGLIERVLIMLALSIVFGIIDWFVRKNR